MQGNTDLFGKQIKFGYISVLGSLNHVGIKIDANLLSYQ